VAFKHQFQEKGLSKGSSNEGQGKGPRKEWMTHRSAKDLSEGFKQRKKQRVQDKNRVLTGEQRAGRKDLSGRTSKRAKKRGQAKGLFRKIQEKNQLLRHAPRKLRINSFLCVSESRCPHLLVPSTVI
jgi:hypothetical protein